MTMRMSGSSTVGMCWRVWPRSRSARCCATANASSSMSAMDSRSLQAKRANSGSPQPSSMPPLGSNPHTCTRPEAMPAATAPMTAQMAEPLPALEQQHDGSDLRTWDRLDGQDSERVGQALADFGEVVGDLAGDGPHAQLVVSGSAAHPFQDRNEDLSVEADGELRGGHGRVPAPPVHPPPPPRQRRIAREAQERWLMRPPPHASDEGETGDQADGAGPAVAQVQPDQQRGRAGDVVVPAGEHDQADQALDGPPGKDHPQWKVKDRRAYVERSWFDPLAPDHVDQWHTESPPPQRCCAACRLTPSRVPISAQE